MTIAAGSGTITNQFQSVHGCERFVKIQRRSAVESSSNAQRRQQQYSTLAKYPHSRQQAEAGTTERSVKTASVNEQIIRSSETSRRQVHDRPVKNKTPPLQLSLLRTLILRRCSKSKSRVSRSVHMLALKKASGTCCSDLQ